MDKKKQTRLEGYGMSSVVGSVILGPSFVGFIHSILPFKIYILSSFLCSIEIEWADSGLGKSANGISVRRATTQNPQKGGKRQEENFQGKLQEENFQGNFQHENFQAMGLAKGMEVRREGGRIVFVGCEDVVIDLLAVEPWIPRLCIPVHVDQYQQYAASADFVVSCLAIKLTNESTDNIGLGPLVILANYGNTDTNANTLKGNSEQALTKAVQQEWRLKLLINLHKILLAIIYNENERQIITAVANIFEIGEITHPVLVGLCASLWGLGYSGTSLLNASVREIINKTGKQVFVAEAEVIMGLQGNFSERIHQTLQMILQGPESVQPLVQNNEKYNFGYILGVCIGLKALCNKEDSWLKGIVSYINSEEEEENTERNGNRVSMVPKFFSHSSSWRKLLNLLLWRREVKVACSAYSPSYLTSQKKIYIFQRYILLLLVLFLLLLLVFFLRGFLLLIFLLFFLLVFCLCLLFLLLIFFLLVLCLWLFRYNFVKKFFFISLAHSN